MDQNFINALAGVVGLLGGWWMKVMWDSLRDLRRADKELTNKIASIEVLVAGEYVRKNEFDRLSDAIFKKLDRIEAKLDGKADK